MTVLIISAVLILLLILVISLRSLAFRPPHIGQPEKNPVQPDTERAMESLAEMIRCRTVSSKKPELQDDKEFERFRNLLKKRYPKIHARCKLERIGKNGLLYHWKGKNSDDVTVLMAHYDVVPAREELWTHPPFEGKIEDDVLWGRGTLDTKISLCAVMESAEQLIGEGFQPAGDIYFSFAGDEEIAGDDTPAIVETLEQRGIRPSLVLDEGGAVVEGIFPGVDQPCALVGIAEKGIMNISFSMKGDGGHASAPPPHTLVGELAQAAVNIEHKPFPGRLCQAAAEMFDTLGRHSTPLYRIIFSNLWLFLPLLNLLCKKQGGELNALMRTSCALTMFEGSSAPNVLPPSAIMTANLRLISGDSVESAKQYLKKAVGNSRITLSVIDGMNPSTCSRTDSAAWEKVSRAISQTWEGAIVSPYLMIACSDSRHYHRISDHVYRFSVMELSKAERALIHGNDERINRDKIEKAVAFYLRLIPGC